MSDTSGGCAVPGVFERGAVPGVFNWIHMTHSKDAVNIRCLTSGGCASPGV